MSKNKQTNRLYFDEAANFDGEEEYWLAAGWLSNQWNAVIRFTTLGAEVILGNTESEKQQGYDIVVKTSDETLFYEVKTRTENEYAPL